MENLEYLKDYVYRALSLNDALEAPEETPSGELYDGLCALHDAHQKGGKEQAKQIWFELINGNEKYRDFEGRRIRIQHITQVDISTRPKTLLPELPIYSNGLNMIVGDRGTGKSLYGVRLACTLSQDMSVMYVAGEAFQTYRIRAQAYAKYSQIDIKQLNFHLHTEPVNFMEDEKLKEFLEEMRRYQPALIILDPIVRFMTGYDENSTKDMNKFIDNIEKIRREFKCALLLIHHTNKQGYSRGSSVLEGAMDSVLVIRRKMVIHVYNDYENGGKNKHEQESDPVYYQFHQVKIKPGPELKPEDVPVLIPADEAFAKFSEIGKPHDTKLQILEHLQATAAPQTVGDIVKATNLNQRTVYENIRELVEANLVKREGTKRAITSLGEQILRMSTE